MYASCFPLTFLVFCFLVMLEFRSVSGQQDAPTASKRPTSIFLDGVEYALTPVYEPKKRVDHAFVRSSSERSLRRPDGASRRERGKISSTSDPPRVSSQSVVSSSVSSSVVTTDSSRRSHPSRPTHHRSTPSSSTLHATLTELNAQLHSLRVDVTARLDAMEGRLARGDEDRRTQTHVSRRVVDPQAARSRAFVDSRYSPTSHTSCKDGVAQQSVSTPSSQSRSEMLSQWRASRTRSSRVSRPKWYTPISRYSGVSSLMSSEVDDDDGESTVTLCSHPVSIQLDGGPIENPCLLPDSTDDPSPSQHDTDILSDHIDRLSPTASVTLNDRVIEAECQSMLCDRYVEVYYDRCEDALVYFDPEHSEQEESDQFVGETDGEPHLVDEHEDTQDPVCESVYESAEDPTHTDEPIEICEMGDPADDDLVGGDLADNDPTDDDLAQGDPDDLADDPTLQDDDHAV